MKVELIYDTDCRNIPAARSALLQAFARVRLVARWSEWDRALPSTPAYAQRYGSPTILVDGIDVAADGAAADASACRVYPDELGRSAGAPPVAAIAAALRGPDRSAWRRWVRGADAPMPAIAAIAVPKVACPLCIPVIGSALGAAGVESFDATPWSLALGVTLVGLTLWLLARHIRGGVAWRWWAATAAAGSAMLAGRFLAEDLTITLSGAAAFIASAILSTRAARAVPGACSPCAPSQHEPLIEEP